MHKATLMIQGTTSDAGKSTVVAGLCRLLHRRGMNVAPFKPQNMALNSAVTTQGGEIGRAQAVQAEAAGLAPHTDMNPVLIKPNSDVGAQIIVNGKAIGDMDAQHYHDYKHIARQAVLAAYQRLQRRHDLILVEGAGSPAEINLRANDIANMGFAEAVDCPVILVADIDRGGVFAHIVGTLDLLSASERGRISGFVINRFRGDIALLQSGLDWLEQRTGKPVVGVLPYLHGLHLEAEDALPHDDPSHCAGSEITIIVPALPRISNHTDFDPLRHHPQVHLQFIGPDQAIPPADVIILPGSKNTRADLAWLRQQGWESVIQRHLRYGGKLMGICGGFQMLGQTLHDPYGVEDVPGSSDALGLLSLETTLAQDKQLKLVSGHLALDNAAASGYEIHRGHTIGDALQRPAVITADGNDGALSEDDQILGTYWHGLFEHPEACATLLRWAGIKQAQKSTYTELRTAGIERLADALETHLDLAMLDKLLDLKQLSHSA